jgi:MFS family permease
MLALGLASLGLFLIPQYRIIWLFPIFLGLGGIGYGIFLTSANTSIGEVTSEENRGSAVGLYNTFSGIGGVLNMTILGYIASSYGVDNTFRFTSIMCFFGLIIINILSIRARKPEATLKEGQH